VLALLVLFKHTAATEPFFAAPDIDPADDQVVHVVGAESYNHITSVSASSPSNGLAGDSTGAGTGEYLKDRFYSRAKVS